MRTLKHTVLAIADDGQTRKTIREGLSSRLFTLRLASTPNDGLSSFLRIKPDFVIISLECSSPGGVTHLKEICDADPQARIIVVSACTDHAFILECIRQGASDYLRKPLKPEDLQHSVDRISSRSRLLEKDREPDRACVLEERKVLRFGNDLDNLPYVVNQAVANASVVCPDIPMLKMALGEVLLNAIEHGNLGIGMKEKSEAMGRNAYADLLGERLKSPRFAGKQVTLHVRMTRDRLVYRVIDQGKGFDYRSLFKRDPHVSVGSGLGLLVAKSFFTRLSFRGPGNEVVLVYERPGEGL